MRLAIVGVVVLLTSLGGAAMGEVVTSAPSFTPLGFYSGAAFEGRANAVSADGSVVVGRLILNNNFYQAFRWTRHEGMTLLGDLPGGDTSSQAYGITPDGNVILGESFSANGGEAVTWSGPHQNVTPLVTQPGGFPNSFALASSSDASVIVGSRYNGGWEAFRWTAATGPVGLGDLPGGRFESFGNAVSADGAIIVGSGSTVESGNLYEAFQWSAANGIQPLPDFPTGHHYSRAESISADGSTMVGYSAAGTGGPVRWNSGGIHPLTTLTSPSTSIALGVSGDGGIIVGHFGFSASLHEAFICDSTGGLQNLRLLLQSYGLNLSGWRLDSANAISADGRTIVGYGRNPQNQQEAWVAVLPEPQMALTIFALGPLMSRRYRKQQPPS